MGPKLSLSRVADGLEHTKRPRPAARHAQGSQIDPWSRRRKRNSWAQREGSKLAEIGVGTTEVIQGFDIEAEVQRILTRKSGAGKGAHSDYCRVAGRYVNDWLSAPHSVAGFLQALEQAGWIKRGEPAQNSNFWNLRQGERAEMFGVFSNYELQVIHDWIRGEASADGQAYATCGAPPKNSPLHSFRARQRLAMMVLGVER